MFILHPWPIEPLGARISLELTEREPISLTSSAGERLKRTQEGPQSSTKVRKTTVRLAISFLRICQSDITENKPGKTTADLTVRGWQELLALSHSYLDHSTHYATQPFHFLYDLLPNYLNKHVLRIQRLQRNEVTS